MSTRVLLHAPTADALERARSNARNLLKDIPDAQIRIIANAQAVKACVEGAEHDCDAYTYLCPNTLRNQSLSAPERFQTLEQGAITALVKLQAENWIYIRA
ncbi:hypothetical protein OSH04_03605 [Alcaligenes sp. A-TC2]|uniref:DsrE family protein n=1 Tax=Alcaligenes TaxID=507 RepID=UPI00211BBDEC|nr:MULTISPECIES: hypothetical protein [Alcaligenes]MCX5470796.1 hypothetical protein [Alcaligenes nematophilus]MDK7585180.1 hypothetical protein [Alcaligenes phenolicus]UUO09940.1 hypothetical protein M6D76_12955 [Alcaligenes faecalis]